MNEIFINQGTIFPGLCCILSVVEQQINEHQTNELVVVVWSTSKVTVGLHTHQIFKHISYIYSFLYAWMHDSIWLVLPFYGFTGIYGFAARTMSLVEGGIIGNIDLCNAIKHNLQNCFVA